MLPKVNKHLLRNTIRSTDFHNRNIEEEEMWRQKEHTEKHYSPTRIRRKRNSSDDYSKPSKLLRKSTDNYYSRKLMEIEENDPARWGHSGYKELYPDEFVDKTKDLTSASDSESRNEEKASKKKHKKKKTHKSCSKSKKHRKKKHKKKEKKSKD